MPAIPHTLDIVPVWDFLSSYVLDAAAATIGVKPQERKDWFNENDRVMMEAIAKHR